MTNKNEYRPKEIPPQKDPNESKPIKDPLGPSKNNPRNPQDDEA